jgi:hypothetical protein
MSKDWKVMNLLMSQLVDLNQKQLDGIYNLPTGASFYIPSQAAAYYPGGGMGGLSTEKLEKLFSNILGGSGPIVTTLSTAMQNLGAMIQGSLLIGPPAVKISPGSALAQLLQGVPPGPPVGPASAKTPQTGMSPDFYLPLLQKHQKREYGTPSPYPLFNDWGVPSEPPQTSIQDTGFLQNMLQSLNAIAQQARMDFKLNLTSTSQLVVDGRVLANVVKKYLAEDMINFAENSITKSSVI